MDARQEAVEQLDILINDYKDLVDRSRYDDMSDNPNDSRVLANRLQAAISRLTVPSSSYARQAELLRTETIHTRLQDLFGIIRALRDDLSVGWFGSLVELVHADVHGDFLDMADELLLKGYKDAAAVIVGSSLEVHLRALCEKHAVSTEANGKPKKADTMNGDLKKSLAYGALEQKQVTAWLAIRNSAAHGNYDEYVDQDVRLFIAGIRSFMARHPA